MAVQQMQKSGRGLNLSKLPVGTKIILETCNSVYEIVVEGEKDILVSGGKLDKGKTRFPEPTKGRFVGCKLFKTFYGDRIEEGMGVVMDFRSLDTMVTTSAVRNVVIISPDESWRYSMDWDKVLSKSE